MVLKSYLWGLATIPIIVGTIFVGNYIWSKWVQAFRQKVSIESIINTMNCLPNIKVWHLFGSVFFCRPFDLLVSITPPTKSQIKKIKEMMRERG